MDPILQTLFSWQFVIFSMAIAAIMFVLRTITEYIMSNCSATAKESKLWNDLLLPILPVLIGPTAAVLIKKFPYPDGLTTSSSRLIFGLVAGLLSTLLYRVFKALLMQKANFPGQGGYPYPGGYPTYPTYPTGYPPVYNPNVNTNNPNNPNYVPPSPVPTTTPNVNVNVIAQPGVITPDNPTNIDDLTNQVRQTINNNQ